MGLSTAGFAYRATSSRSEEAEMIRRAFGEAFRAVPESGARSSHDIRVPGNIAVESKNGATFVYNSEFTDRIIFKGEMIEPSFLSAFGNPELVVVFCHYDSGGSFGYVIIEGGKRTRARIHTLSKTSDEGTPKDFERSWLQAEAFVEEEGEPLAYRNIETGETASEPYVTARMLDVVMKSLFGVCPWDEWDYKSNFNYYRRAMPGQSSNLPSKRPWWKLW